MGEHVDMRILDGRQRAPRQLLRRLATAGVDAGDDDVEAGEQLVRVVERRVGADLELGAMEDPERRELGVQPRDLGALRLDAVRGQAARHPERRRVIGEHDVLVPAGREPRAP